MHATARTSHADPQGADAQDVRDADYERRADCQYMRALERANEVRLARAALKRNVAAGAVDVAEVVLRCPWEAESMAVSDLLTSQRRWGHTRCRKLLAQVPLTERKTLGSMTDRQRRSLAVLLSGGERREPSTVAPARPQDEARFAPAHVSAPPASRPAAPSSRRLLVTV
jgi:hypothetical protein